MKISNEELKKIFYGAYRFSETSDGYLMAHQYTEEQEKYFEGADDFWFVRCDATTAKTLEFTTEATNIAFDYKVVWMGSPDSFEICIDGLISQIIYLKDIAEEGNVTFELPSGKKDVIVYLPADSTVVIKNFEIDAEYTPAVKGEKVLWLGDSITQGYGPLRSSQTYVSVANRILNYDILNQGIGGYIYDPYVLKEMNGYRPDKIIIALGTNQYGTKSMNSIERYYEIITELYKGVPIIAVTPLWRGDNIDELPIFYEFCKKLTDIASKYDVVNVVDGLKLVPHLSEYFLDNLHPNQLGTEVYANNLVREIKKYWAD